MNAESVDRPRRRPRSTGDHWCWLIICCSVVAFSFLLEVRNEGERVGSAVGPGFVLPSLCFFRGVTGLNCPGCGLTRSFLYLARGDLTASWQMHHLGWLFALAVVSQIPYRIYRLWRPGGKVGRVADRLVGLFGVALTAFLLGNWLLGFVL